MKKFCALQITPEIPNPEHVKIFSNQDECDFFFVTHDAANKQAMKFCPNTTWTDTRNVLIEGVPKNYEYYGFVDYDYVIKPLKNLGVKEQILEDLNDYNPAVLTYYPGNGLTTPFADNVQYRDSRDASVMPFSHAGFKFVHHSLLKWFFPMITKFGGGVESCHLFNILELPFLKHVVCSHKMLYDNGVSDVEAPHNQDAGWSDYRMNEMWKWLRPAFKKIKIVDHYAANEQQKYNAMLIKAVFQKIALEKNITPVKAPQITDYFDKNKIKLFFDLEHERFINLDLDIHKQFSKIDPKDELKINKKLSNITFNDLKTKTNPWINITKDINSVITNSKKLTTSECVEYYQKNNGDSIFMKSCNINTDLSKYLKGKRVAYVGPAPYLQNQSKGALIDSFDVVVRIQHGIPNYEDYGTKTDIIQSCLNSNYGPPLVKHLQNIDKENRPKFIICNDTASEMKPNGQWALTSEVYEPIFSDLKIPFVNLKNEDDTWDRWVLYWEIYAKQHIEKFAAGEYTIYSANFNSGYGAINMLLSYPLKELAVFGLDFYNSGIPQTDEGKYHKQYTDTYGKSGTPLGPDKILHDQLSQMMHCKNVLLKDSRLILDRPVLNMLNSDSVASRIQKFVQLPKFKNETL